MALAMVGGGMMQVASPNGATFLLDALPGGGLCCGVVLAGSSFLLRQHLSDFLPMVMVFTSDQTTSLAWRQPWSVSAHYKWLALTVTPLLESITLLYEAVTVRDLYSVTLYLSSK
jgi:hypothetical protein